MIVAGLDGVTVDVAGAPGHFGDVGQCRPYIFGYMIYIFGYRPRPVTFPNAHSRQIFFLSCEIVHTHGDPFYSKSNIKGDAIPERLEHMGAISVVLADDHPAVLHGVADVLTSNSQMIVVAACSDGTSALQAIRKLAPTVAVLDIFMPGLNGLDVVAAISAERCPTKVVVLTAAANDERLLTAIASGAKGIILKETALHELVQCVQHVAAGGQWLPSTLIDAALTRGARGNSSDVAGSLTSREGQIVQMVAGGLSNKEIGRRLDLSEGTVKVHLHNVYSKLGVNNRTALAAMAITRHEDLQLGSTPCESCGYRLQTISREDLSNSRLIAVA